MARQINGHVGTFATVAELSNRFPASEYMGCSANVGAIPPYSKMWSDGYTWNGFNNVDILALQALENVYNQTGYISYLQNKLDTGFGTLAFSRSSVNASVVDCYGSMQFATTNEARFYGARRVENKITDSENATTGWTFAATPTASALKSPNHGRKSSWTVSRGSGTTQLVVLNSQAYRPGKWCLSFYVWGDGTTQYTVRIERSSDLVGTSQLVTPPAGEWTRIAVLHDVVDTSNHRGILTVASAGAASVTFCDPQMEWVHGQTSPAPSDYVPKGVSTTALPASVYAGEAGVDGVRYYTTYNPWTLSSGVATRSSTVSNIPTSLLKGIAVAGASSTNQVYSSANIGAASEWTKNGSTTVNATPADSTLLGKNSLWKLEQGAATQEHRVQQSWRGTVPTSLPTPISASCYAKAGDAACPFVWMWLQALNGSTNYYAYFNLQTGQVGSVTSGAEAWMVKESDCWSLNLVISSGSSGSTAPILRIGVTQTNNLPNPAGTAGNGNWIGAVQLEQGLPTSYMGDTSSSASLTRVGELLTATSTNMSVINWTVAADFTCRYPTATALKPTWLYLLYTYTSQADRGGFGLRPAAFGGFYDGGEDEIFFDWYPGISADNLNWDGIHIKGATSTVITAAPLETYKYQWSASTSATQPSGGNQSGTVGAVVASSTGNDMPRPAINSWPTSPRIWTIGRQSTSIAQRGELYCANLVWYNFAKTSNQMLATT